MAEKPGDWGLKWDLLVADVWVDPALKGRLLADTDAVLRERGIEAPEGKSINVVEATEDEFTFVLPPQPPEGELSEEELATAAGGFCVHGCGHGGGGHGCGHGGGHGGHH
jgi:hypothetical protein